MRIVAMKRKIIVALISFTTIAAFNGVMQAASPPDKNEGLLELTDFMHANGAVIISCKNRKSLGLLPFDKPRLQNRKEEDSKKGQADKPQ
jgi:hypothetical protein